MADKSDINSFRKKAHENDRVDDKDPRQAARIDDSVVDDLRGGSNASLGDKLEEATDRAREAAEPTRDAQKPTATHEASSSSGRDEPATLVGGNTSETARSRGSGDSGSAGTASNTRSTGSSRTSPGGSLFPQSGGGTKPPGCQTTAGIIAMVGLLAVRALRK